MCFCISGYNPWFTCIAGSLSKIKWSTIPASPHPTKLKIFLSSKTFCSHLFRKSSLGTWVLPSLLADLFICERIHFLKSLSFSTKCLYMFQIGFIAVILVLKPSPTSPNRLLILWWAASAQWMWGTVNLLLKAWDVLASCLQGCFLS